MRQLDRLEIVETPVARSMDNLEYLQGYRAGQKAWMIQQRHRVLEEGLSALLAIALLMGIGYLGYSYAAIGKSLPPSSASINQS